MSSSSDVGRIACAIDGCRSPGTTRVDLYAAPGADAVAGTAPTSGWPVWMCDDHAAAWRRNSR